MMISMVRLIITYHNYFHLQSYPFNENNIISLALIKEHV